MNKDKTSNMLGLAWRLRKRADALRCESSLQNSLREANRLYWRSMLADRGANRALKLAGVMS